MAAKKTGKQKRITHDEKDFYKLEDEKRKLLRLLKKHQTLNDGTLVTWKGTLYKINTKEKPSARAAGLRSFSIETPQFLFSTEVFLYRLLLVLLRDVIMAEFPSAIRSA